MSLLRLNADIVEDVRHYEGARKDITESPISAEIGTKGIDWYYGEKGKKNAGAKLHHGIETTYTLSCYSFLLKTLCVSVHLFLSGVSNRRVYLNFARCAFS